jgi:regulator of sigma E protease
VLVSVLAFIVVIGVLIFVHEAGHFLAAKAVGIQVLRFSLGFGRPLIAFKRGETEYWISWLPVGGYVKMAGMEEEGVAGAVEGGKAEVPIDPNRTFESKPLAARLLVTVAGVTMNMVFAIITYAALFGTRGESRIATTQVDTVWADSLPAEARALTSLARGDRIIAVNGESVTSWEGLIEAIAIGIPPLRLTVAGRPEPIELPLPRGDTRAKAAVLRAIEVLVPPVLEVVEPNSRAARAGLSPGDTVLTVNADTITSWGRFTRVVRASAEETLSVAVRRGESVAVLAVTPERRTGPDPRTGETVDYGYVGVSPVRPIVLERYGIGGAIARGAGQAFRDAGQVVFFVKGLFTGDVGFGEVGGPITIGRISGQAARRGVPELLAFMAILSVNLAVLNLLPIPILDGATLLYLLAEGVRRRPLSVRLRVALSQVGFVLLITLMALVIGREFLGLFSR